MKKILLIILLFWVSCQKKEDIYMKEVKLYLPIFETYVFLHRISDDSTKIRSFIHKQINTEQLDTNQFEKIISQFENNLDFHKTMLVTIKNRIDSLEHDSLLEQKFNQFLILLKKDSLKTQ